MSKKTLPPHGNRLYPWEQWERAKQVTARRGKEFGFDVTPQSFRRTVITRAHRQGLSVTTRVVDASTVVFQFGPKVAN